ncbi:MAG TPA: universal stress protein, partial [Bradyrhizobium sp.]|nr:universal stress protein [Bradyrhizobium sp.]
MIKDIIVSLAHGGTRDPACDYAVSIAQAFQAHLAGIAFAYEPVIAPSAMAGISVELIDAQREDSEKAADASLSRFEQATTRAGISVERHRFAESAAGAAALFGRMARMFDLVIVGQTNPENGGYEDLIITSASFDSGRPVIVIPYIQKEPSRLGRIIVCWDAGRTAARAVAEAMPLLERANKVQVLSVSRRAGPEPETPSLDVAQHLARHGVNVEVQRVVNDIDVAA